jgi:hypothetical protein
MTTVTTMKTMLAFVYLGLFASSAFAQAPPSPMKGSVAIRVSSVLRSGQKGDNSAVSDDLLPGETTWMFATAGQKASGCDSSAGGGEFSGTARARVEEQLKAAQFAWRFNVKMLEVSTDRIVFDIESERASRAAPNDVDRDTTHFVMREGESRPFDMVHPGSAGDCAGVALDVVANIKEDEVLAGMTIDWDLWLVTNGQSSPLYVRASSLQGVEVPFQFEQTPVILPGSQAESSLRVYGKVKGRLRRDGTIEVEMLAQRSVSAAMPKSPFPPNESGQKFFTIKPGEAIKIVLPPLASARLQTHLDPVTGETVVTAVRQPAPASPAGGPEMSLTVQAASSPIIRTFYRRIAPAGANTNPLSSYAFEQVPARKQVFYVIGNINRPGAYEYEDGMVVGRAIEIAGGITSRGSASQISLKRMVDGRLETIAVTLESAMLAGDQVIVRAEPRQGNQ